MLLLEYVSKENFTIKKVITSLYRDTTVRCRYSIQNREEILADESVVEVNEEAEEDEEGKE